MKKIFFLTLAILAFAIFTTLVFAENGQDVTRACEGSCCEKVGGTWTGDHCTFDTEKYAEYNDCVSVCESIAPFVSPSEVGGGGCCCSTAFVLLLIGGIVIVKEKKKLTE